MQKLLKISSKVSVTFIALVFAVGFFPPQFLLHAQAAGRPKAVAGHSAKPQLTGDNGSTTGIAGFQGNFTSISAPPGQALALYREENCSLTLATATYNIGAEKYTQAGSTPDYERVLHSEAGLTTTPDVFATKCARQPAPGVGSAPGAFVGLTATGIAVFAAIGETNLGSNGLWVLAGTTSFTFNDFALASASALTSGDLNGDGNADLVITNSIFTTSGSVYVMLGNPDGTFKTGVSYPTAGAATVAAVVDDVNGDGKLDIVTVSNTGGAVGAIGTQQISVLLGKGDGTFAAAQTFAAPTLPGQTSNGSTPIVNLITADLRHIGKKDIIGSNGAVLLGNGDGTFTPVSASGIPYTQGSSSTSPNLASGDFNKDGKIDVVVSNGSSADIYLGNGDGTFTPSNSYSEIGSYGFIAVDDLDGDGNPDIYVGLGGGGVFFGDSSYPNLTYALMGHGDGTFAGAPSLAAGYNGNNLVDLNGDGKPDLVFLPPVPSSQSAAPSSLTVALGTATGIFKPVSTIGPPASFVIGGQTITSAQVQISTFAIADVNGDGKPDVVFAANDLTYPNPISVYFVAFGNGNGTFQPSVPYAFPQIATGADFDVVLAVSGMQIADFTGSGHNDLIFTFTDQIGGTGVTTPYLGGFVVLPGNGDGTFKPGIVTTTYSSATAPATGLVEQIDSTIDVNGDGKADLLAILPSFSVATGATTQIQLFLGNGDGTFKTPTTIASAPNPNSFVLADFNGDGKLDLAGLGATSAGQAEIGISLGTGNGAFAAPATLDVSGGSVIAFSSLSAADFNGDGKVDLALIIPGDLSGIYYGNGDGTFTSVVANGLSYPKDLINISVGEPAVAVDLNGDGKPDILAGGTSLLNIFGATPPTGTAASTTALTASATTITTGASVTLTATITGAAGSTATPTGTVTFLDGTATLGTGTLSAGGVATYATTALAAGSNSITAIYSGDTNFNGSTSVALVITVNAGIATTTKLSASATSAASGTNLTFTALVSPASGSTTPTGTVTFLDGATTLGTGALSSGSATFSTATLAVGSHSITAAYAGATGFAPSTSAAVVVTISAVAPGFTLGLSSASGTATGNTVTSTITVTPAGGFNQAVSLACTGAPQNATCSISPASVTPSGTTAPTATLTINTNVSTSALNRIPGHTETPGGTTALAFLGGGALLGFSLLRRRRANLWFMRLGLTFVLLAASAFTGCGGGSNSSGGSSTSTTTPAGTYTITVTATSGSIANTATYSLTVQ